MTWLRCGASLSSFSVISFINGLHWMDGIVGEGGASLSES